MRRFVSFLMGILILIAMLGLLFFAGAIYDAENKYTVDSFFFQLPAKAKNRINSIVSADDVPDSFLRELIISRFVNDYFYVIPDIKNAELRQNFKNSDKSRDYTAVWILSSPRVYNEWAQNVAPEITELAKQNVLRTVRIIPEFTESESGHLIVKYELTTWTKPNDVLALPEVSFGELYIDISKRPVQVMRTQIVLDRLKAGVDPVAAFDFRIQEVIRN